ncbi:hypothetical protein BC937DRAFT_86566 [Endogone sp. FLAS-F59071]|nr:hypothetical protein BC937DRAFT_86566 [Endogone sp. FLAS-F59071]|eukprot:RUS20004.1 hypothetical protein BC937DRAFT_86566 [Endogone sp. FLAS-F59071]
MAKKVLWIQLEAKKRPYKHCDRRESRLDDLATEIYESDETEDEDRPLRSGIQRKLPIQLLSSSVTHSPMLECIFDQSLDLRGYDYAPAFHWIVL